jgi:hypothetical protein
LAVLRPTPGSASSAARSFGTSLSYSAIKASDSAMTFFALVLNRPIVLMCCFRPSSPKATICSGVFTSAKSARVALLTPASVAWADSTTATSSWKTLPDSSSVSGCGFASARRR